MHTHQSEDVNPPPAFSRRADHDGWVDDGTAYLDAPGPFLVPVDRKCARDSRQPQMIPGPIGAALKKLDEQLQKVSGHNMISLHRR
jgi:hypothetical protein